MIELLAIPTQNNPPRTLDDWVAALNAHGHAATIERDPPDGALIEVGPLNLRGFALIEGDRLSAIDFELHAPDPAPALAALEAAADDLGWELHEDEGEDDEDLAMTD